MNIKRLSADWETVYGHPIVMVETFVDHSRFKAICYRAAGWVPLGTTTGYGRTGGIYYYHGQSKTVLVKPPLKNAATILSALFLPSELTGGKRAMVDLNTVSIESRGGLLDYLALLKDSRKSVVSGTPGSLLWRWPSVPSFLEQDALTLSVNGHPV
ncbi:MAG TPA: hypothetical protein DEH07_05155 [Desulfotomaculum sp.]|nr:hypothetical protein [Desulfotomaculum sp.]